MKKRCSILITLMLVLTLGLTGCGSKMDGTQTAAVMDEQNIPLAEINLMLRYQQAQMETAYSGFMGENVFQKDLTGSGTPYGEVVRDSMIEEFEKMYILEAEAPNYGVELTEDDNAAIKQAAEDFLKANGSAKVRDVMTASEDTITHLLQLITIQEKMRAELTADVDTNVSDEEAAQKKVTYLFISKESTEKDADGNTAMLSDEELAKAREEAQAILDDARQSGDLTAAAEKYSRTPSTLTYGADSSSFPENVMAAANALGEGEFSEVLDSDNAYYVIHMDSLLDREATDNEKESIVNQRKTDLFNEKYDAMKEEHTFEAKDDVLKQITFNQILKMKTEE